MFVGLAGFLLLVQVAGGATDILVHAGVDAAFVAGLLIPIAIIPIARTRRMGLAAGTAGTMAGIGLYLLNRDTLAAWGLITVAYLALTWLDRAIVAPLFHHREEAENGRGITKGLRGVARWLARLILAGVGGLLPIVLGQIESDFAEEEFFVALQGIALAAFCFLLLSAQAYLQRHRKPGTSVASRGTRWLFVGGFLIAVIGLGIWGGTVYQDSFYSETAPNHPQVAETSPFFCGKAAPDPDRPSGAEVYQQLLSQVEANRRKDVPELGMLALATGDLQWAEAFRDAVLDEAKAGLFTEPAHSVKSTQYRAALRVYYTPRVRDAFPELFSTEDWETLRAWFAAVNRRALTAEWVDWLYALAFSKWPAGPYENQEIGAGLLSILEAEGLSAPDLSPVNRDYLERNRRGWTRRFHNTDDTFVYQGEWLTNAYFQSLYWNQNTGTNPVNRHLSFEWMLLQALPDGAPLRYNHPRPLLPVGLAYLAARLEDDPRFLWWGRRMLDWAARNDALVYARPGAEHEVNLQGTSPAAGSCLLYSNSGLPNQMGPLAPDKIVFRDGWTPHSTYALLNLRFSGWHRYKATNSLVLLYQDGPIVVEKATGDGFDWLPRGRSLFRDKRIPRENLNGLLVSRTGWSQVVHRLTGIGGQWAQDPPTYARVEAVNWLGPVDVSRTVARGWRGWRHTRTVYLVHGGPIIIVDSARGKGQAALTWHLVGESLTAGNRLQLRDAPSPVQMILSQRAWENTNLQRTNTPLGKGDIGAPNWDVTYRSPRPGRLDLTTVFTVEPWTSARYETQDLAGGKLVELSGKDGNLTLLQNNSGEWLQAQSIATDSRWALSLEGGEGHTVCFAGGTSTQLRLGDEPAAVRNQEGGAWQDWEFVDGVLTLHNENSAAACLNILR